jgi:hypothetical protein
MSTTHIKRKWAIDFNNQLTSGANIGAPSAAHGGANRVAASKSDTGELKMKKAWEAAKAPGKGIFMTAFMMWMAGSGVNIFTMMFVMYAMINPLKAIFGTNAVFEKFAGAKGSLLQPKLLYIAMNLASLGVAVYKCASLGLLPTTPSDWIALLPVKQPVIC